LIYKIEMEQSQWERTLAALQTHLSQLEESLSARMQRFTPFKNLFNDVHKACDRFAASLVAIADACDQDILSTRNCLPICSHGIGVGPRGCVCGGEGGTVGCG